MKPAEPHDLDCYPAALARLLSLMDDTLARGRFALARHDALCVVRDRLSAAGISFNPDTRPAEQRHVHERIVWLMEDAYRRLLSDTPTEPSPSNPAAARGVPATTARALGSRHRI